MKKRILLLSVLMTLGVATFLSSCKKEDDDDRDDKELSCKCEIYDEYYDYYGWTADEYTETYDQDDLDELRVDDCDELEELLYEDLYDDGDNDEISCKED